MRTQDLPQSICGGSRQTHQGSRQCALWAPASSLSAPAFSFLPFLTMSWRQNGRGWGSNGRSGGSENTLSASLVPEPVSVMWGGIWVVLLASWGPHVCYLNFQNLCPHVWNGFDLLMFWGCWEVYTRSIIWESYWKIVLLWLNIREIVYSSFKLEYRHLIVVQSLGLHLGGTQFVRVRLTVERMKL